MKVYHVTSIKKLMKYINQRKIKAPVRAWTDIKNAEAFSIGTGRQIIIRLKFPDKCLKLEGHRNKAVFLDRDLPIENIFGGFKG